MKLPFTSRPSEIPNEEYHRGEQYRDYFSSSMIKNYLISPKFARYSQLNPSNSDTPAKQEGTIYHDLLESHTNHGNDSTFPWVTFNFKAPINPSTSKAYGVVSAKYQNAYEIELADFMVDNPGVKVGPENFIINAKNMVGELLNGNPHLSPDIATFIKNGVAEQSHFLEYKGGLYKFRTDVKTRSKIIDWKKTRLGCPKIENWGKEVVNYGYHISAAMYQLLEKEISGKWKPFYWVAQENEPPYDFNIIDASGWTYEISGGVVTKLNSGALILAKLMGQHQWCNDNQQWPGYSLFTQPNLRGRRIARSKTPGWYENKVLATFYN